MCSFNGRIGSTLGGNVKELSHPYYLIVHLFRAFLRCFVWIVRYNCKILIQYHICYMFMRFEYKKIYFPAVKISWILRFLIINLEYT